MEECSEPEVGIRVLDITGDTKGRISAKKHFDTKVSITLRWK
jgi:hypothetical protein